jgi:IS605 OrfB family transposase
MKARGNNPRKLIFGGKKLFFQLKKNHLRGNKRKKLYEEWKERRQGNAYSRGQKHARGNLNFRFLWVDNQLYMRINVGKRNWIYARVRRKVKRQKDKWINFVNDLLTAIETGRYFPYSVELKLRNGEIYAFVTIEERIPETRITKTTGVIGIDINASPFHLALTEISSDGNLLSYQRINLNEFIGTSKEKRNYLAWQVAHKVIDFALRENKAIAIERLKNLPKGKRGDGLAKLRQKLQQWSYKSILEKIEILAKRNGIEVIKVYPSFTSIIGKLKYAPQYNIDKDIAGAFVIGRRALGFTEKLPKNYKILSQDLEFLMFSLAKVEDKIEEIKEKIKKEGNEYKANALKKKLKDLKKNYSLLLKKLNSLQSGKSEPTSQQPVNRGKERVRGNPNKDC